MEAIQSGYASVSRALQSESLKATERAELIAAPLLLIVLLLVFRSLMAAAIPLAFGALTVFAGRGVLVLLDSVMTIEALSVVVCTMMGLALGVDYSLFIVSRFREELARGASPWEAARITRRTAGRTTLFAGATLFVSILLSSFLQPGSLLLSLATALVVVTPISVAIAWFALPTLLALLGERINAGAIGRRGRRRARGRSAVAAAAERGPAPARPGGGADRGAAVAARRARPRLQHRRSRDQRAAELEPGPAERRSDRSRRRPGLGGPLRDRRRGPARPDHDASPARPARPRPAPHRRPAAGARGDRPGADPARRPAAARARPAACVRRARRRLRSSPRVGPGLRRAAAAVAAAAGRALATPLPAAACSAPARNGRAREPALLAGALERAAAGGARASDALERLAAGSKRLAAGQQEASSAGLALEVELHALASQPAKQGPAARPSPRRRTRSGGSQRPRAAGDGTAGAAAGSGPRRRARQGEEHARHRDRTARRSRPPRRGGHAPRRRHAAPGGQRLRAQGGLEQLSGAAHRLADRAGRTARRRRRPRTRPRGRLPSLLPAAARARASRRAGQRRGGPLARGAAALRRRSPHLFDSGYFVLSALDGAPPVPRALAGEAVNVGRGGQAARLLVVSTDPFNTAGSRATGALLNTEAARLAREGHLVAGVSGGAAILNDYGSATKSRLPLVIGAIVLITFMMLVAILRAPLLAALAVVLNLASVAAAVGVVSLICKVPAGYPLGGHSYIDTVGAAGIFGVTFGLSIDYAVFLLARMRERREAGADNAAAIAFGLEKTAGVITGAAAIMAAVFVSFAAAPIATVSQLGVGLTVAILLDATVVRIVLLPALMLLLGDRVWHVPTALDRLLPRFDFHAAVRGRCGAVTQSSNGEHRDASVARAGAFECAGWLPRRRWPCLR